MSETRENLPVISHLMGIFFDEQKGVVTPAMFASTNEKNGSNRIAKMQDSYPRKIEMSWPNTAICIAICMVFTAQWLGNDQHAHKSADSLIRLTPEILSESSQRGMAFFDPPVAPAISIISHQRPSRGKRSSHKSPFPFARWWNWGPVGVHFLSGGLGLYGHAGYRLLV